MTLSTTLAKQAYDGDGTTTAFPTVFKFLQNSHVVVTHIDPSGFETVWAEGTHYTLTGAGSDAGGTVVVLTSPNDYTPANGDEVVISRSVPETQEISYPDGGAFPAATHEQALDLLTMMVQKHSEEIARALLVPIAESTASDLPGATARAGKFLAFDASGNPIAASGTAGENPIPVSSFMETLLDDADASFARLTLGLAIGSDVLAPDGDGSSLTGLGLTGQITMYGGATAPAGWLICDGSAVSRTSYSALFTVIGTTFGAGDGSTSFNLPDMRGRVPLGVGTGDAPDATAHLLGDKEGAETHTLTVGEMPAHTHTQHGGSAQIIVDGASGGGVQSFDNTLSTGSTGGGDAHNNLQPHLTVSFIIKQ